MTRKKSQFAGATQREPEEVRHGTDLFWEQEKNEMAVGAFSPYRHWLMRHCDTLLTCSKDAYAWMYSWRSA
ncbi:protein of unknown function [Candidatus Filomicrobium marinum]|uniref:Uncharacterized protein n=1 Tax=Candidatus Filomicrobium marinum TaxID=1608628 RepID=A0A0D6JGE1_9HYPH|nr:protein of unknown function [Candidatus Filomicrobium marinum]CPR19399.1 protein of unknown function [Candidatus Filomicrobium marinum]